MESLIIVLGPSPRGLVGRARAPTVFPAENEAPAGDPRGSEAPPSLFLMRAPYSGVGSGAARGLGEMPGDVLPSLILRDAASPGPGQGHGRSRSQTNQARVTMKDTWGSNRGSAVPFGQVPRPL